MKTKNVLIAVKNKNVRSNLIEQFHSRGFNILSSDMTDFFDSSILDCIKVDFAVIEDPRALPGGMSLLKSIQKGTNVTPTVILSDLEFDGGDSEFSGFPCLAVLAKDTGWDEIVQALMDPTLALNVSHGGRRHARQEVNFPAFCEVVPNRAFVSCNVKNVSRSGAFISAKGFVPKIGQIVEVEIDMGDNQGSKLFISGIVRWSQAKTNEAEVGFGIEFGLFNMREKEAFASLQLDA